MNPNDPHVYDLRRLKVGEWESAKIKSKVNGRWIYFYKDDNKRLINCPELINYEKKYIPPNHREKRPNTSLDVIIDRDFSQSVVVRAPIVYTQKNLVRGCTAPMVYKNLVSGIGKNATTSRIPIKTYKEAEFPKVSKRKIATAHFVTRSVPSSFVISNTLKGIKK